MLASSKAAVPPGWQFTVTKTFYHFSQRPSTHMRSLSAPAPSHGGPFTSSCRDASLPADGGASDPLGGTMAQPADPSQPLPKQPPTTAEDSRLSQSRTQTTNSSIGIAPTRLPSDGHNGLQTKQRLGDAAAREPHVTVAHEGDKWQGEGGAEGQGSRLVPKAVRQVVAGAAAVAKEGCKEQGDAAALPFPHASVVSSFDGRADESSHHDTLPTGDEEPSTAPPPPFHSLCNVDVEPFASAQDTESDEAGEGDVSEESQVPGVKTDSAPPAMPSESSSQLDPNAPSFTPSVSHRSGPTSFSRVPQQSLSVDAPEFFPMPSTNDFSSLSHSGDQLATAGAGSYGVGGAAGGRIARAWEPYHDQHVQDFPDQRVGYLASSPYAERQSAMSGLSLPPFPADDSPIGFGADYPFPASFDVPPPGHMAPIPSQSNASAYDVPLFPVAGPFMSMPPSYSMDETSQQQQQQQQQRQPTLWRRPSMWRGGRARGMRGGMRRGGMAGRGGVWRGEGWVGGGGGMGDLYDGMMPMHEGGAFMPVMGGGRVEWFE
ncbi:unnamed protein product [Vitrella brassicaformis CCMP3155]|uniref:Uncharacterized protein n=1 Tax=Vitrella brassicaformis (strain CCMP3155) TaxID=1169540 RepID=A0A0G4EWW4_VITBC|nr:unnamed protein product [Vitrella brassicaformis CCMP3155]|eukprot:CEM03263.1 unnamed protein product [Vitrella brassicaformis CCMP3155]